MYNLKLKLNYISTFYRYYMKGRRYFISLGSTAEVWHVRTSEDTKCKQKKMLAVWFCFEVYQYLKIKLLFRFNVQRASFALHICICFTLAAECLKQSVIRCLIAASVCLILVRG